MESDVATIARVQAGERDAYRLLVERYSRVVFRLAYRLTGHEQDAEDVVQETFLRAYQHLDRFDQTASFPTWIYRIATNAALDLLRQRQRSRHHSVDAEAFLSTAAAAAPGPLPDRLALSQQVGVTMAAALTQLSPQERAAFVLRHFEGHSIEEIGSVMGTSSNATKQSIFRAVQKLRRALASFGVNA